MDGLVRNAYGGQALCAWRWRRTPYASPVTLPLTRYKMGNMPEIVVTPINTGMCHLCLL